MFLNLYKRCFAKITKWLSIHSFVSELTRKYQKLQVRRKLTRAQKKEIQSYYKQLTGMLVLDPYCLPVNPFKSLKPLAS